MGWNTDIFYSIVLNQRSADGVWGDYQQYANFRFEWIFNWQANSQSDELLEALLLARQNMRVFGYRQLRFNEYYTRGEWPTE